MLDVRFSADYVRFSPKSGRIDTVTVESARDPERTNTPQACNVSFHRGKRTFGQKERQDWV